ncbi:cation-translocating P-type ATPase [Massilia sp. PAMC28688]|uniref:cation-translocating P-type ATPase n=1 Tax=Massilia sp. PAMC28688 TaxID=2861283 RepID=UPI001C62DFFD|nr:cation-translocating P-type ATPase [Massilia sp. PAMC28688]QYF93073.1 cation-translocating P-type ATPase [Massilia sp. PAMC28688]
MKPSDAAWHSLPAAAALEHYGSSEAGLSAAAAAERLGRDGPNQLREDTRISPFRLLLEQFKSVIIWILIAAGVISGLIGELVDALAILAIVILNAAIGFYQEYSAEKSIAALKKMLAPMAKVWRDGALVAIPGQDVVAGDLLALEAGDLVAADARLLSAASLKCVESALTGESEGVAKLSVALAQADVPLGDRSNMVFTGTMVVAGTGLAVVVSTGMSTELGQIAVLLKENAGNEATPLQRQLDAVGRILVWAALGMVGLLFLLGMLRGTALLELTMSAISLAVAAVPEGLPAVVTVALSLGVLRMSRRRALVRRLPAVETLGSTTVICTDKTGTLTAGQMTVRALYVAGQRYQVTGDGYGPEGTVEVETEKAEKQPALLLALGTVLLGCNNAQLSSEDGQWQVIGDPTESALLCAGAKAGADRAVIEQATPKYHEIPFDSDRKRSTVIRTQSDGSLRAYTNGAPDVLLALCTNILVRSGVRAMTDADREQIEAENATLAGQGLRVLGSAWRDLAFAAPADLDGAKVEADLVFVGLTGMYDPPRQEAKDAVARCRAAGIRVVMITGDHPHTAMAIARELGIADPSDLAVAGADLDRFDEAELRRQAPRIAVYARVSAAHKLRIVGAWKANGAVVAMTGDGVNDAPAIQGADIGIAMGKAGTEVTKQAADMIVTDDNFASIVAAVEEGRGVYANIRKTLQYLLAGNTGELLLMTACVAAALPAPLLPIHLLWINLVTDGLPALCLATDPIEGSVMERPPRARAARMTDRSFVVMMLVTGLLTAGVALAVYLYMLRISSVEMARTYAFAVLVFAELLRSFGARSETLPVWRISLKTNLMLVGVVFLTFWLQVWSHHNEVLARLLKTQFVPLQDCLILLAIGAIPLAVLECVKLVRMAKPAKARGD